MTNAWKQPEPTKAYAVWFESAWYGEGDTVEAAWADVRKNLSPQYDRYGATLYAKIKRHSSTHTTRAELDRQSARA